MDFCKFRGLDNRNRDIIKLQIRLETIYPERKVSLEHIRANLNLIRFSDAAIYSCIKLLVDEGRCVLTDDIPNSYQLKNGYIYQQKLI